MELKVVNCGNKNVIHVDEDHPGVLELEWSHHMIHYPLECTGGIALPEKHNEGFIQPEWRFERCLPLVAFLDSYVMISPAYVEFGKKCTAFEISSKCVDIR